MIPIVHLITSMEVGGAETALVRLVSRMDRSRFRCTVLSLTGPGPLLGDLQSAGIQACTLTKDRSINPRTLWRLAQMIRRARPRVLQTWLYHADLLGLAVGRAVGVPAIAWNIRCTDLDPAYHSRALFWIRSTLARLSARPEVVVVNSEAGRRAHERFGYRPRRWESIPNGFDTDLFAPSEERRQALRRELGIDEDAPVVGLVARYHPMKDHRTFLEAMSRAVAAHPALRVLLAGRGVDEGNGELTGIIEKHGLRGRVMLLGEMASPARLLVGLDVTVSSSFYGEGFPNIIAESMACGVPVVATDAGDSARIIGRLGAVVPSRNPHALALAVGRLLACARPERVALGLAARERIRAEFSLDAVVGRYEQLYVELAEQTVSRRH